MPSVNGAEFLSEVAERYPDTKPKVGFKRSRFDFEPVVSEE